MKLLAQHAGITKVEASATGGVLEFADNTKVDPSYIIKLIQTKPDVYRLDGPQKIRFTRKLEKASDRINTVSTLLENFSKQLKAA